MNQPTFKTIAIYLFSLIVTFSAFSVQAEFLTFYHNDATGSPIAATDEQGNVLWTERREPFGEPKLNQSGKDAHRVDYTGHVYDKELGLHYQGARYYDPVIGRFMGFDPVGFYPENVQSFNRYAYANNNPYRFYDPDGQVPLDTVWDAFNVAYDIGKITVGYTIGNQTMVVEGAKDLAFDFGAMLVPYVPAGASKVAREGAEQAVQGVGKRKYMDAIDGADGPHTVWKKNNKGEITNHQSFEPNANPKNPKKWVKGNRTDISGKSEFNKKTKQWVDTPHTHDKSAPGGIRPAKPNELPKQ